MIRKFISSFVLAVATTLVAAAASHDQPGDQCRWSLDFRARMEQPSAPPIEIRMTGDWISTLTAVRPGEFDAQLQLANVQFIGDAINKAPAGALSDLQTRYSHPFWATYRNDGGLIAIHFLHNVSASDRNLLQMIATELQLVLPETSRASWTAQERDGAGEYSALYLMPEPGRILKRKLKYLYTDGVAGAPTDAVRVAIDESATSYTLTEDRRIQGVDGMNRVRMDLNFNQSEKLTAETEFHVTNLRTGRAPELIGSLEQAGPDVSNSPIVTQRPDASVVRAEADERLLKGYTTEALLMAAFIKSADAEALPDRLAALFRSRPEAAAEAVALLIKNGPRRIVTNALGAAGSPSAVAALSSLAHNSTIAEKLRVDAITGFVQMQHPSEDAMHVPVDLLSNSDAAVQLAARMISGALSRAGRPEHRAEADAIDDTLNDLYRHAQDPHEKIELLSALGNSAGPSVKPVILEAMSDSQSSVRAAAARALRLAPGPDVDTLLATVIASDKESAVRADAIFATRFRRPLPSPIADALLKAASADADLGVRSGAVSVLAQNPSASSQIPEALAQIAQSDRDAGIRRQAREALAAISQRASAHP